MECVAPVSVKKVCNLYSHCQFCPGSQTLTFALAQGTHFSSALFQIDLPNKTQVYPGNRKRMVVGLCCVAIAIIPGCRSWVNVDETGELKW